MSKWFGGLLPGGVAAVLASLVSLPLESPDDLVFNTATVTIGALAVGLGLGALRLGLDGRSYVREAYVGVAVAAFAAVALAAVAGEAFLSGSIEFVWPLAAIVFAVAGPLTPLMTAVDLAPRLQQVAFPGTATGASAPVAARSSGGPGASADGSLGRRDRDGRRRGRHLRGGGGRVGADLHSAREAGDPADLERRGGAHGQTQVEARMEGDTLQVVGRTDFTWADFEISPPDIPDIVDVEDNVHIEVLVIARAEPSAGG